MGNIFLEYQNYFLLICSPRAPPDDANNDILLDDDDDDDGDIHIMVKCLFVCVSPNICPLTGRHLPSLPCQNESGGSLYF